MAPTPPSEIKVLITGYGPFQSVVNNPSWLAVKPLHDRRLDLSHPPSSQTTTTAASDGRQRAHIQCIQLPVHYGSILDTIPRLHGAKIPYSPDAKLWFDSRCDSASDLAGEEGKSYPEGYAIRPPNASEGEDWDLILHVGVGARGGLECETLARKTGYTLPDAGDCLPPVVQTSAATGPAAGDMDPTQETEKAISQSLSAKDGRTRGFGKGYEQFAQVQRTDIDVQGLLAWLEEQGIEDVKPSINAGLYLCEFIYYNSLAEAKRRATEQKQKAGDVAAATEGAEKRSKTDVMFVHVPPVGHRLDTPTCTDLIQRIAWYCARQRL